MQSNTESDDRAHFDWYAQDVAGGVHLFKHGSTVNGFTEITDASQIPNLHMAPAPVLNDAWSLTWFDWNTTITYTVESTTASIGGYTNCLKIKDAYSDGYWQYNYHKQHKGRVGIETSDGIELLRRPDQVAGDIDGDGTVGLKEAGYALQTTAGLGAPDLMAPENGAEMDNACTDLSDTRVWDFDWSDVPGAVTYQLYVIHQGAIFPVIDITVSSSDHREESSGYMADSNRFDRAWKVRAADDHGVWGEWSEIRIFDVEPLDTDCPQ